MASTDILINPPTRKNPQRGDEKTPLLQKPDNSQCMGNSMQSCLNWIAEVDHVMKGLEYTKFNTYNYYIVFETWLLQKQLIKKIENSYSDPTDQVYTLSNHVNCFNEILISNNSKFRFTYYGNASLQAMTAHIAKYKRPIVLGTKLSNSGHIIRIVGYGQNESGEISYLKADDPFGNFPYMTEKQKSDGYYVDYACDLAKNTLCGLPITRMVTIDEI